MQAVDPGQPPVFAVIDGIGTWTGDNELCITQEGHTPMIGAWTTITNWTAAGLSLPVVDRGRPGPGAQGHGAWGVSSGRLGHGKKVGVVVSDQAGDQTALHSYLLPDLKKAGITPQVYTDVGDLDETASTDSDAQLAVERLKAAGVQSVIPMLPENAFFPYVGAENPQQYFPQLLLSDYQSSIEVALGLIPQPYEQALNGQEGVTTETLGGFDDDRPQSKGGYDPGVRSCYATWHKAHPKPHQGERRATTSKSRGPSRPGAPPSGSSPRRPRTPARPQPAHVRDCHVEHQGLSRWHSHPIWSFGPDKMYGPTTYTVVKIHNNVPPSSQCILKTNHKPQGTCWVVVQKSKPLPRASRGQPASERERACLDEHQDPDGAVEERGGEDADRGGTAPRTRDGVRRAARRG